MSFTKVLKGRERSDYPHLSEYKTRWSDNDMYSHMNNGVYLFLFDSIINSYLIDHCGRDPASSDEIGIVVHSECNFFASVGFPAVLELGLRVNKIGNSSVTYEVGVFEQGQPEVKTVGGYTHVFVNRATMRPSTSGMSRQIRDGLTTLCPSTKSKL